jgi:N-dimethylarginine dimethylaminohydrolase
MTIAPERHPQPEPSSTPGTDSLRDATDTLAWGRAYTVVSPDHFRIDYRINPFMDVADQPDAARAREQWDAMVEALLTSGASIDVLRQRADSPDMVYAMNLGLALTAGDRRRMVMSHMRFEERRAEGLSARPHFEERGFETTGVGEAGVGAIFESGDAFPFGDALVVGFGKRTDEQGLKALASELDVRVRGLRITHPGMYHLDLAFCPLDERRALVCPEALDAASAEALLALVPEPLVLTEAEALTFCANSVVVDRTVIMPTCPDRVRAQLEAWGFEVVLVDVGEFHKGGGSIRCLTNPTDIVLGRDLPEVPGGEVVIPA